MKNHILIGTYHKTGSVWMLKTFRNIARKLKVPFVHITPHAKYYKRVLKSDKGVIDLFRQLSGSDNYHIIFDDHSRFHLMPEDCKENFKGIRVTRDPVSVICSAANYHTWSEESWLHLPKKEFNGMTYQQKIKSFETDNERYQFEMRQSAYRTIKSMAEFEAACPFIDLRFEKLMKDTDFVEFSRGLGFVGLENKEKAISIQSFFRNSVFGEGDLAKSKHIQNKNNKAYGEDWTPETRVIFKRRIADLSTKLGY